MNTTETAKLIKLVPKWVAPFLAIILAATFFSGLHSEKTATCSSVFFGLDIGPRDVQCPDPNDPPGWKPFASRASSEEPKFDTKCEYRFVLPNSFFDEFHKPGERGNLNGAYVYVDLVHSEALWAGWDSNSLTKVLIERPSEAQTRRLSVSPKSRTEKWITTYGVILEQLCPNKVGK